MLTSLFLVLFYIYEAINAEITGSEIGDSVLRLNPNLFLNYGIFLAHSMTDGICGCFPLSIRINL